MCGYCPLMGHRSAEMRPRQQRMPTDITASRVSDALPDSDDATTADTAPVTVGSGSHPLEDRNVDAGILHR